MLHKIAPNILLTHCIILIFIEAKMKKTRYSLHYDFDQLNSVIALGAQFKSLYTIAISYF
jgi:hypothetical protein